MCLGLINGNVKENKNLLILGAGGHGRVVKETAEAIGIFNKIDFLDDNSEISIGVCSDYEKFINEYKCAFVAIGNPELRKKWLDKLTDVGYEIPILIHPTAYVSPSAKVGTASFIGIKAAINTRAIIENGCIIGIGALVDHDSCVEEYSHINAGAIVKAGCTVESFKKVDAGVCI